MNSNNYIHASFWKCARSGTAYQLVKSATVEGMRWQAVAALGGRPASEPKKSAEEAVVDLTFMYTPLPPDVSIPDGWVNSSFKSGEIVNLAYSWYPFDQKNMGYHVYFRRLDRSYMFSWSWQGPFTDVEGVSSLEDGIKLCVKDYQARRPCALRSLLNKLRKKFNINYNDRWAC